MGSIPARAGFYFGDHCWPSAAAGPGTVLQEKNMGYGNQIAFALILSIPVACITWTVTQEEIFATVRLNLARYPSRHGDSWWRRQIAYAPTCPYCLSHYVAAMLVALLNFKMLADDWRGYLVSLFTIVLIANVYITIYHVLRVGLRWERSLADRAETAARTTAERTVAGSAAVSSMGLMEPRRNGRRIPSDRRE